MKKGGWIAAGLLTIGTGLVLAAQKVKKLTNLEKNIVIEQRKTPQVDITKKGMRARIYIDVKNPTKNSMNLSQPFVKLIEGKDNVLASSSPSPKTFQVTPNAITQLDTIEINLPYLQALTLLKKGAKASISVFMYVDGIEVSKNFPIKLKA